MRGSRGTNRRKFLSASVQATLGASMLPAVVSTLSALSAAACSRDGASAGAPAGAGGSGSPDAGGDVGNAVSRPTSIIAELEDALPRLMAETHVPGLSIVLIRRGRIAWRHAFGVADSASKRPVTVDTIFEAQSMSKPVFAYVVMKLRERGLLDLDAPLTKYAADRLLSDDPRLNRLTARHVLSHTSGLPNWRTPEAPLAFHFTPGERWEYSGEGYWYLSSIVTKLTGGHVRTEAEACKKYEAGVNICASDLGDYLKAQLLVPFDMKDSGYVWNASLDGRVARPHDGNGQPLPERRPNATDATRYASAGGLLTTPTDYAKFLIEVIDPKPADTFRLTRASRDEMVRAVTKVPGDRWSSSWALGWQLLPIANGVAIAHGGSHTGMQAFSAASIERKSGFVVMMNGDGGEKILLDTLLSDAWRDRLLGS